MTPIADILTWFSGIVVLGFALFLLGLAVLITTRPAGAKRFLGAFASTAKAHFLEQGLRLIVGAALVNFSGSMRQPELFRIFGWLLVVTAVALLLTPWRWHQKFAGRVMPPVMRHLKVFALGAAALAVFILYGLSQTVA